MLSVGECWAVLESHLTDPSALPPGATANQIRRAESTMNVEFPDELRELLLRHDGSGSFQISPYKIGGGGQAFMPIEQILMTWKGMTEIGISFERDGEFGMQSGPIKRNYWNRLWIPILENGCGDNIFLDLDPAPGGTLGQVVDWCHEDGRSTVQSSSLLEWLNEVVQEIKSGTYTFGSS